MVQRLSYRAGKTLNGGSGFWDASVGGASAGSPTDRIGRERKTVTAMVHLFCRGHHRDSGELCPDCRGLLEYSHKRLDKCVFGGDKPTCARCPVHCYEPSMRQRMRTVMRYSGPRMLRHHPVMAMAHMVDGRRKVPEKAR